MQQAIFAVGDEPYLLWEEDVSERARDFLSGLDPEYFSYVLKVHATSGDEERTALGIRQENDVRFQGWMLNWSDDEVARHLLGEFRKRETVWCDRLLSFDKWPVLFVCGANHVESFSSLLAERGLDVEVLESCWEAKP